MSERESAVVTREQYRKAMVVVYRQRHTSMKLKDAERFADEALQYQTLLATEERKKRRREAKERRDREALPQPAPPIFEALEEPNV